MRRRAQLHPALRAAVLGGALAGALACGGDRIDPVQPPPPAGMPPDAPRGPLAVGSTYLDANGWIELRVGDAPLVVIAPHGGALAPSTLADRMCTACITSNDLGTQELARAVVAAFARRTGATPHLVVNRLHRRKFDGNRELVEATGGQAALEHAWRFLQASIDSAVGRVASRSATRGLVIDLHGHGHAIARLELGYLLDAATLRRSDAEIAGALAGSSIARLATDARSGERGAALLRGDGSLGALLAAAGYPSVPSPAIPAPLAGEEYFNGGFNTARASRAATGVDAIQLETHYTGVRDTAASRETFADALALALQRYLERQYGWSPPRGGA